MPYSARKKRVLIIEDERAIALHISEALQKSGYGTQIAYDGAVGVHLATTESFDVILLDINLPFIDGIEVCRRVRENDTHVPVIMLTEHDLLEEKIRIFDMGADDYLMKPLDLRELEARVKVFLRRARLLFEDLPQENVLQVADLVMNVENKTVARAGKNIDLTAKEFLLLEYLIRNKGRVLSKTDIIKSVWDISYDASTNVVEVYVNFLRKKIDKGFDRKLIHTRSGMGYVLREE
jgi:DNA-binding response OmpR family regulator